MCSVLAAIGLASVEELLRTDNTYFHLDSVGPQNQGSVNPRISVRKTLPIIPLQDRVEPVEFPRSWTKGFLSIAGSGWGFCKCESSKEDCNFSTIAYMLCWYSTCLLIGQLNVWFFRQELPPSVFRIVAVLLGAYCSH